MGLVSALSYNETGVLNFLGNSTSLPLDSIDPRDVAEMISISKDIGVLIMILFVIGLVMLLFSLVGLIYYRKDDWIRYTGVKLNFILVACLLVALCDILLLVGKPSLVQCPTRPLLAPWALSMYYGFVLVKNLQIYKRFYNFRIVEAYNVMSLRTLWWGSLFAVPNIIIWVIWYAIDAPAPAIIRYGPDQYQYNCNSGNLGIGKSLLYATVAYNSFVVLCSIIVSYKLRKIDLKFNESQMMKISVYNLAVIFIIVTGVLLADGTTIQTQALFRAIAISYIVCLNCTTMFIYKFYKAQSLKKERLLNGESLKGNTIRYKIPTQVLHNYEQILPAIVFVKRCDGVYKYFTEPLKALLIGGTATYVWVCPLARKNPGDSQHKLGENGEIWAYTQNQKVMFQSLTPVSFKIKLGNASYEILFELEAACNRWKPYFEAWAAGKEPIKAPAVKVSKEMDRENTVSSKY